MITNKFIESDLKVAISLVNEAIKAVNKHGINHPATKKLNLMADAAYRQIQEKMKK